MDFKSDDTFTLEQEDFYRSFPADLSIAQTTYDGFDQEEVFRSIPIELSISSASTDFDGDNHFRSSDIAVPSLPKMGLGLPSIPKFGSSAHMFTAPVSGFDKFSVSAAPTSVTPSALPLPPAPFFLEPASNFQSESPLTTLVSALESSLTSNHVDFYFKAEKCKWRGKAYMNCHAIDIRVQVFELSNGQFAVEFQRRNGDLVGFRMLYASIFSELKKSGIISVSPGDEDRVPARPFMAPRKVPVLDFPDDEEDSPSMLQSLLPMMRSPFVDVQIEAIRSVAQLSFDEDNWGEFKSCPPAIDALVQAAGSRDVNVSRCALSSLAQLTRCPQLRAMVVAAEGIRALKTAVTAVWSAGEGNGPFTKTGVPFSQSDLVYSYELVRHSVRALANLAESPHAKLVQDHCASQLRSLLSFPDAEVRKSAAFASSLLSTPVS